MASILLVESETNNRCALRNTLTRSGHSVVEASGITAASVTNLDEFDLVVCRLELEDGPGTDIMVMAVQRPF